VSKCGKLNYIGSINDNLIWDEISKLYYQIPSTNTKEMINQYNPNHNNNNNGNKGVSRASRLYNMILTGFHKMRPVQSKLPNLKPKKKHVIKING